MKRRISRRRLLRFSLSGLGLVLVPCLLLAGLFWERVFPVPAAVKTSTSAAQVSSEKCSLHGTNLRLGTAQIVYGYLVHDSQWDEARTKLFPNSMSWVGGG
ncbi:MAG: hypothetical protein K2Z81_00945 [Cyanobacteria bacterium]|nr:hypothetical protein [Cyanobacteriota bacterium]